MLKLIPRRHHHHLRHYNLPYSYYEINPSVGPTGYRETPKFSPFEQGRHDREWTDTTALLQKVVDMSGVEEQRNAILGEPLSELVERYRHSDCSHQILTCALTLF
ncbi:hypothetical protein R6Q57_002677 [Mikania cordata]